MKRIHDFKGFLNEANAGNIDPEIRSFFDALEAVLESTELDSSYSRYAENHGYNPRGTTGHDPAKDFQYMLAKMAENDWAKPKLDELFDQKGELILDIYNGTNKGKWDHTYPQYGLQCGGADVFLYYMTEKEQMLSGIDIKEFVEVDKMYDEYWIKFAYGYHKTGYGKLAVEQQFEGINEWYNFGGEIFLDSLYEDENGAGDTLEQWKNNTKVVEAMKEAYSFNNPEMTIDLSKVKDAAGDDFEQFKIDLLNACRMKIGMESSYAHNRVQAPKPVAGMTVKGDIITIDLSAA